MSDSNGRGLVLPPLRPYEATALPGMRAPRRAPLTLLPWTTSERIAGERVRARLHWAEQKPRVSELSAILNREGPPQDRYWVWCHTTLETSLGPQLR
jgi:hypothetical protein